MILAMEHQVPQFIEVEDKIIGPLTLRQFIYLAGGGGLVVILLVYLPLYAALPLAAPIAAFSAALAFYKLNGKPFIEILEAGFQYLVGSKLFLWRHKIAPPKPEAKPLVAPSSARERLSRGKLAELAWSLDVRSGGGETEEREA